LGKRILVWKRCNFDLADNLRDKLCTECVGKIDNGSKGLMTVALRGRRWSNNNN
jgi:hypothetical protein